MKNRNTLVRSSLSFPVILMGAALISGIYFYGQSHTRQYKASISFKGEQEEDAGAEGMYKYFFDARKDISTNSLNIPAMLQVQQQIMKNAANKRATSAIGLNWHNLGPSNIGGRTRAIIIDNQDPTHNTLFAAGVSGGIWKSTDAGASWNVVTDQLSNICVSCLAQDPNGNIYAGTGEGFSVYVTGEAFSTGILGGGIFKSTDDGNTFSMLTSTTPNSSNSISATWAYTNRIAIQPNNPQVVYAGTNVGLMVSTDGGNTWAKVTGAPSATCLDVKMSADGSVIVACIAGSGYYAYPSSSNSYQATAFTAIASSGYGKLASSGGGRIEFAIAPSDANYIYASVVSTNSSLLGIYMTKTAVSSGKGGIWYLIGPGGTKVFDPYSSGGVQDQGDYDNTLGVFPNNSGKVLVGGTTLWEWDQNSPTDTVGGWSSLTSYWGYPGDPTYIHPDEHAITIDNNNPNIVYVGCDGGVYKSTDGAKSFVPENRNFDITQFYAIACSPQVDTANGEGVMGGTQDNGTPYMSGTGYYPQDAVDVGGGDGGQSAISSLNPNAYYVSTDGDALLRSANLSGLAFPSSAYTTTEGLEKGANIDSVYRLGSGCFVDAIALYENSYDTKTLDSLYWIADKSYSAGDTVYPVSPNGNLSFPYKINKALVTGDTIKVQNRVVSKLATGFTLSNRVWIMMQAADFQDLIVWMPIGGPESKPDAATGNVPVHCLSWSPDGDALFVGTENGQFFRFSNLDSIIDTSYRTGGIEYVLNGKAGAVVNPYTRVISKNLTSALGVSGRDILSIAVDPKNGNNVLVTVGNYNNSVYVLYSSNALSASPTFKSVQGNLPKMPVYGAVLDIVNSSYSKGAVLATEHGIYTTTDITAASPTWSADNNGMANTLVCAIKQQTLPAYQCNNSGNIYLGTHGRGAYVDNTFYIPTGIKEITAASQTVNMKVYPNPMNTEGNIQFTLAKADKVTIRIYDIQGRIVQEIPVSSQAPGVHNITFNAQAMPAGTYLATLTGTNFRKTTRFVVAR